MYPLRPVPLNWSGGQRATYYVKWYKWSYIFVWTKQCLVIDGMGLGVSSLTNISFIISVTFLIKRSAWIYRHLAGFRDSDARECLLYSLALLVNTHEMSSSATYCYSRSVWSCPLSRTREYSVIWSTILQHYGFIHFYLSSVMAHRYGEPAINVELQIGLCEDSRHYGI